MTDELSPIQALALWGLLARQGRAPETEVKPKADRDALIARGFAEADKPSKTVSLTDRGWNWASEHLGAPSIEKQPLLTLFLGRLGEHLAKSGESLAEFIGNAPPLPEAVAKKPARAKAPPKPKAAPKEKAPPKSEAAPKEEATAELKAPPKQKAPTKPKASPKPKPPAATVLRKMIEEAYLRASGDVRSEPVRLSKLRAELGDLDRKTVDIGLGRIFSAKREKAHLTRLSDNKSIDEAERKAAFISPAGEEFHLIRMK